MGVRRTYIGLKDFDLKVGDEVIFPDRDRRITDLEMQRKIHVGTVVGVYPHIFHIRYRIGANNEYTMHASFRKLDYQLGEVARYESN